MRLCSDYVSEELGKMCATKELHFITPGAVRFHTPINAVLENSDKNRARIIARVIFKTKPHLLAPRTYRED